MKVVSIEKIKISISLNKITSMKICAFKIVMRTKVYLIIWVNILKKREEMKDYIIK